MEKQVKIIVKEGIIQGVITNFEGSYQIIDYGNKDDIVGDIYEPDLIMLEENIFEL